MSRPLFALFIVTLLSIGAASAQPTLTLPAPTLHAAHTTQHSPRLCSARSPCLITLRLSLPAVRLRRGAPSALSQSATTLPLKAPSTSLRLASQPALGLGKRVTLRGGRELSLQLTPTPTRCAPLLSVRY